MQQFRVQVRGQPDENRAKLLEDINKMTDMVRSFAIVGKRVLFL